MATDLETSCPSCGAEPGQLHALDCEVEPCPYCGCHLFGCKCSGNGLDFIPMDDRMPWSGRWPGVAECDDQVGSPEAILLEQRVPPVHP